MSLSASVYGSTDPESNEAATSAVQSAELDASNLRFAAQHEPDEAHHVTARDGTRLALSVYFPPGFDRAASRAPVVYIETGHGRGVESRGTPLDLYRNAGFIVVIGEPRGFGASFGVPPGLLDDDVRHEHAGLMLWLAAAPWSNGKVVSVGWSASYDGVDAQALILGARSRTTEELS
jgi:predicted acyl esterase